MANLPRVQFQAPNSVHRYPWAGHNHFAGFNDPQPESIRNNKTVGFRIIHHILREWLEVVV